MRRISISFRCILQRPTIDSFMQAVWLEFDHFHMNFPRSMFILWEWRAAKYPNIEPFCLSKSSVMWFWLSNDQGGARCQEFQVFYSSFSRVTAAWQKDLHIEHDNPSQLMRPTVCASIMSALYYQPGRGPCHSVQRSWPYLIHCGKESEELSHYLHLWE